MNKEQAIEALKELQTNGDAEIAHGEADRILCELLTTLGCREVVDEWEKVDKWYA